MKLFRLATMLSIIVWFAILLRMFYGEWATDMSAVYIAGFLVGEGHETLIYETGSQFFDHINSTWATVLVGTPNEGTNFAAYIYPPLWGWVVAPLTKLVSAQTFFNGALVVQLFAMLGSILLGQRLAPEGRAQQWVLAGLVLTATSVAGLASLKLNQPQISVTFLLIAGLVVLQHRRSWLGGGLWALAAALKLQPAVFIVLLAINHQWRALLAFTVIGGGLGVLSLIVGGWSLHETLLAQLAMLDRMTGLSPTNAALEPLLVQLDHALRGMGSIDGRSQTITLVVEPIWVRLVTKGLFILGLAYVWRITPHLPEQMRLAVGFLLVSLLIVLVGPFAGTHYYILPILALPALFHLFEDRTTWRWIVFIGLAANIGVYNLLFEFNHLFLVTDAWIVFAFGILLVATLRQCRRVALAHQTPEST